MGSSQHHFNGNDPSRRRYRRPKQLYRISIISIPAVLSSKKWGLALVIIVLVYTLSTSVGILIYYQIWLNAVRVAINIPAMIHLFKVLFEGKIK
jgi:hypothetical protein